MPQKVMLNEIVEDVTATETPTQEEINRFRESDAANYMLSDSEVITELAKEKNRKNISTKASVKILNKDTVEDFLSRAGITPLFLQGIGLDLPGMGDSPHRRRWHYGLYVVGVNFHLEGMPWPRAGYTGNSEANRTWWFRKPLSQYISEGSRLPPYAHEILRSLKKTGGIPLDASLAVWTDVQSPAPDIGTMSSMLVLELFDGTCIPVCKIEERNL